jgi:predicted porin
MENFAMKKSLVALAVLGAFGGSAFAQAAAPTSSVTLFGVIDLSARYTNNGNDTRFDLATDGLASSRLGVRGVEQLGGGMTASFWFEGAVNADDGTAGGQTWRRRQTASLTSGFGEVRLGRDYTPTFWNATVFDPFGTNGVGAQSNVHNPHVGITAFVRANNSIGYFLPGGMGGLYGQAMVAAGEGVGFDKYMGARVGWKAGPIDVAVSFGQNTNATGPVAGFQGDDTAQTINVGGSWNFGIATLMGYYGVFSLGNNERTNLLVGATAKFGPGTLRASYSSYDNDATGPSQDGTQIALGYIYDLSRRTALYGTVSRISNDAAASFGARSGGNNSGGIAPVAGKNYTGAEIGVRHSF